jgi:hypothetical protein
MKNWGKVWEVKPQNKLYSLIPCICANLRKSVVKINDHTDSMDFHRCLFLMTNQLFSLQNRRYSQA